MKPGQETFINYLPYYHGYGIGFFMLYSMTMGVTNIVFPKFNFEQVLESVQKYKVGVNLRNLAVVIYHETHIGTLLDKSLRPFEKI